MPPKKKIKNGFIVDDFSSLNVIDLVNTDCQAAIDTKAKEMRPKFATRHRALKLKNVIGTTRQMSGILINDYTTEIVDSQPYATKHISVNPYFQYKKKPSKRQQKKDHNLLMLRQ